MSFSFKKQAVLLCVLFVFTISLSIGIFGQEWREVTQGEMQMKTPKVEPDADAEAIFWEIRVDDSSEDLVMKHYVRVKIFTERGREKFSKIDVPFYKGKRIKDLQARVIKPDGTIVELNKADVFEREIAKANKIKIKAKSFAVPNIESGVIVEYRYQEVIRGWANNMRLLFQHDIPIQTISYYFKPVAGLYTKYLVFNMPNQEFVKDKGGFYRATLENVPALKEEPRMPPEDEVRSWMLLSYQRTENTNSNDFWAEAGYYIVKNYDIKDTLKPGKELKTAAEQITAGAKTPDDQMEMIYNFCKNKIKNFTFDPNMSDEEKDAIKANKSTSDTYKKMQGTSGEINELFASLATALGYEARLAFGGDRSEKFFTTRQAHLAFIHFSAIAVKIGSRWKYYDPGNFFTPYGMLPWYEEDTSVLLLGTKDYYRTETPYSSYDKSAANRSGKFKLSEDGTLEGTVKIEYTGHIGYLYKTNNFDESATKREENLKEEIKKQMSAAELSDISIENVSDGEKPFVYKFKVRVPNYAQKTGKRLFLQPGFFEYGSNPLFSASNRRYDIFFNFPWSENDDIEIELPKDFELDSADRPADIADPSKISSLTVDIGIDQAKNVLFYKRKFYFGNDGKVLFPVSVYEPLKNLFDAFHKANIHSITLRQK